MPANNTPETATVISSLPYSLTEDPTPHVADSLYAPSCAATAVKIPVWWVYTPPVGITALGVQFNLVTPGYNPTLSIWTGTPPTLTEVTGFCFTSEEPTQQQINVTPGTAYYFQLSGTTTTPGTDVIFELLAPPDSDIAAGDLFVANDTSEFPAAVLDRTDGTILQILGFPAFECADTDAASGILCVNAIDDTSALTSSITVRLYDTTYTQTVATTTPTISNQSGLSPVSGDQDGTFYIAQVDNVFPAARRSTVKTITTAGVIGGTTWTLPADADNMSAMGVSRDGSTLYYAQPTVGSSAVHAYDLNGNAPLADLVASGGGSTRIGRDIKILSDDTILVVRRNGATDADWQVRRYNAAGVLQTTYTVGTSLANLYPRIALGLDDPTSFWCMSFPASGTSRFQKFTVSSGAVAVTFDVTQKNATDNDEPIFGPSQSCPLLLVQSASSPAPEPVTTERYQIRCIRRSPHVSDTGQRLFHKRLQLDFEAGIGNTNDPGANPIAILRTSDDGGATWSNARTAPIGPKGAYRTRTQWWQNGMARDRVYEVEWADPCVNWTLIQAWIDVEEGTG